MRSYIETGLIDYGNGAWAPDYVETEDLIALDHGFLFDFIDYDFSEAEQALEVYLSGFDDGSGADEAILKKAFDGIKASHPYFWINPGNTALFLNRIIAGHLARRYAHKDMRWQKKAFSLICEARYSPYTDFESIYPMRLERGDRHILSCLLELQKRLKRWLFMVLDDTNPDLNKYSTECRSMLYGYFYGNDAVLTIKTEIRPAMSKRMRRASLQYEVDSLDTEEDAKKGKKPEKSSSELLAEAYDSIDMLMDFTPDGKLPKSVKMMLDGVGETRKETEKKKEIMEKSGIEIKEERRVPEEMGMIVHIVDGLSNLLDFEVYGMINSRTGIRRCVNCGRYFVPEGRNNRFCDRSIPGTDKTCYDKGLIPDVEEAGDLKAFLSREYDKASNKHDAKVRRGTETKEFLAEWRKEARQRKKLAAEGKMDAGEYIEWLKNS